MTSLTNIHLWNVLRAGAALCFIGHGAFGLLRKEAWLPFFAFAGIDAGTAYYLMPLVGAVDIAAGVFVLVSPRPAVFAYMAIWALWTASLRPLTGDSIAELAERAGNYGVPLALLLMSWPGKLSRAWLAPVPASRLTSIDHGALGRLLAVVTALLLAGHGFIGLAGSDLLAGHYASVGLDASLVPTIGALEIAAALALVLRPTIAFALALCAWKLASESLFLTAGAPLWEFVERGGSYAAPLALACTLLLQRRQGRVPSRVRKPVVAAALVLLQLPATLHAQDQRAAAPSPAELLAQLRGGDVVLACRHAITGPDPSDADARGSSDERSAQRNLSAEGVAQARRMGEAIRALKLPIGDVLTSPMYRNRESAELMFGRATITRLLRMTPDTTATRALFTEVPYDGKVRVLMTHAGVLMDYFGGSPFRQVPEGGCVIVKPDRCGTVRPQALITEVEWEAMRRVGRRAPASRLP